MFLGPEFAPEPRVLTISDVTVEFVLSRPRVAVWFVETNSGLLIDEPRGEYLGSLLRFETEYWVGKTITVHGTDDGRKLMIFAERQLWKEPR